MSDHRLRKKLRKGQTRWNQFAETILTINPRLMDGTMLDFGSGVGYFVLEGLRRQMDIWGVDRLPSKITRYARLLQTTSQPSAWRKRCLVADGANLPFRSNGFAAVSSWYVFEHIPDPGPVLRELVRITRHEGVLVIRAQDARDGWEGHCNIPWIPFLSDRLARVWIEEFGRSPTKRQGVYDITQSQFTAILESLGCRIAVQAPEPRVLIAEHLKLTTEAQVRRKAREVKARFEAGEWTPPPENLYIRAQKL